MIEKILVTGSSGQIGSELVLALRNIYGKDNVIASDKCANTNEKLKDSGPFEQLDVTDRNHINAVVEKHKVNAIVHLAAILSAVGEKKPMLAWDVNINGTLNIFEIARERKMERVLVPSSIAAFGPSTPIVNTPQETILRPTTMYGITKVAGELLGDYYVAKFGVDIRGLRYPGIISNETMPGGGTTDYAVAIYYDAIKYGKYECFLKEDTMLPMMYMPDAIRATMELMHAPIENISVRTSYNISGMSFSPKEIAASIKKHIPEFSLSCIPDYRQKIANSWPASIDDSVATRDWGWKPAYDLDRMTIDMLENLEKGE